MNQKTKDLIVYGGSVVLGLLLLICLFQVPFGTMMGIMTLNGYEAMNLWTLGTYGVLLSITQLFFLLNNLALIAIGTIGITNTLGITKIKFANKITLKVVNLSLVVGTVWFSLWALIWSSVLFTSYFGIGSLLCLLASVALLIVTSIDFVKVNKEHRTENIEKIMAENEKKVEMLREEKQHEEDKIDD